MADADVDNSQPGPETEAPASADSMVSNFSATPSPAAAAAAGLAGTATPPPAPVPAAPNTAAGMPLNGRTGVPPTGAQPTQKHYGFFDRVLQLMGGGPQKTYGVNPDTGALEEGERMPGRGELAKHVMAGLLTGLAAGAQQRGPGAGLRAVGAGAEASMSLAEAQDQQKRVQAQKDYENQQAGQLRKFQIQRYNFEELMALRQANRQDQEAFDTHMKSQMELTNWLDQQGAQRVPVLVDGKDVNLGDVPENDAPLMKAYTAGQIKPAANSHLLLTTTRTDDGKMVHHVFNAPNDMMNAQMPVADDIRKFYSLPDSSKQMPLRQQLNLTANMQKTRSNDINNQLKQEQVKTQKTEQAKNQAEAGKTTAETNLVNQELNAGNDPFGVPVGRTPEGQTLTPKDREARQKSFNKDYVQPLSVLQKTTMEFQRINSNPNQTGAEKVTALLNAVGISGDPLKGKGFRINNDIIGEHARARNVWEGAVQKLNTITGSGGPITSKQIADYTAVAQGVVHDAYVTAAQEARRQGLPVDFLPKATQASQPIDAMTAKIYLDAAGGNKDAARKAASAAGWSF